VLIVGALVALLYSPLSPFRIPQSAIRNQEALPLPDKPSIVVLPFVNISGDPEQDYFSDGITEELIASLSQLSEVFVISRNSAFFYKGKAVKIPDVSKELGVKYVLEGSVRKDADQVRIIVQWIAAATDHHLWSERYDRPLKDIFALQSEIAQKIVTTLKLQFPLREQRVLERKTTDNIEAYDYFLRGAAYNWRLTKETNLQARQMFEKAIEVDPQYALACASLGWMYLNSWFFQWSPEPQTLEQAFALGQKALALDDSLPEAYLFLSNVSLYKRQHEQAITAAERCIALAPSRGECYWILANVSGFAGRPAEAIAMAEKSLRLDPLAPVNSFTILGNAYRLMGQYEKAIAAYNEALRHMPNYLFPHAGLAAVYSEIGREEEAKAEAAEVLRINPYYSLEGRKERLPYKDPAQTERFLAALRKAGLK
jgi:TolB-like protein